MNSSLDIPMPRDLGAAEQREYVRERVVDWSEHDLTQGIFIPLPARLAEAALMVCQSEGIGIERVLVRGLMGELLRFAGFEEKAPADTDVADVQPMQLVAPIGRIRNALGRLDHAKAEVMESVVRIERAIEECKRAKS